MRRTFFLFSILIFLSLVIVNQSVFGLFSDTTQNLNNSFTAAANFPSPSPLASVSSSPSASPSGSPSTSPLPSPSGIVISGNGTGSNNTVIIEALQNCTINQGNNANISTNISSNSNTGENSGNSNTGSSTSTINVAVNGGSNSSTGCP